MMARAPEESRYRPAGRTDYVMSTADATEDTLVSIGMAIYNAEDLLDETLTRLTAQDYENIEIILCDDASTDRTGEISQAWARRDPRIRYVRNERNLGIWENALHVFSLARGAYYMWAAHDDIYEPGFVSTLVGVLAADTAAVAAFCALGVVDYDGTLVRTKYDRMPPSLYALGVFGRYHLWFSLDYWVDGTITSALHRRSVLHAAIQFVRSRTALQGSWDRIIPLYCLMRGDIRFVPERLFFRRLKRSRAPRVRRSALENSTAVRAKRLVIKAMSPITALRYYWPVWAAIRALIPFSALSAKERLSVERSVAVVMWEKYKVFIRTTLQS